MLAQRAAAKQIEAEKRSDGAARMALLEERKPMPWSAVWEYYFVSREVPARVSILRQSRRLYGVSRSKRLERGR
jgi:L-rhamnose isomerase